MPEIMEVDNKATEQQQQNIDQQQPEQKTAKTNDATAVVYDPAFLPDMLPVYYKRLFPHKPFYRWLSYGLCK